MGTDVAKEVPLVAQQVSSPEKDEQPLPSPEKDAQPLPSPEKDAQPLPSHQGEGLGVGSVTKPADINPGPPHASSPAVSPSENQSSEKDTEPEIKVFASVEQSASFPGGDRACLTFIEENMRVPELATTYGVKARVIITFLVGKTGELSNIKVIRNNMTCDSTLISQLSEAEQTQIKEQLTQQLSDEAVRIVSIMPRWRPAKINGETQEQRYILPIRFNQETNH
jgi:protein TonB